MQKSHKYTGLILTISASFCAGVTIACLNIKPIALITGNLGFPVLTTCALCATALTATVELLNTLDTKATRKEEVLREIFAYMIGFGAAMLSGTAMVELAVNKIVLSNATRPLIRITGVIGLSCSMIGAAAYHYGEDFAAATTP